MLLKREDTQPVFSFKLRGAYNKMAHLLAGGAGARRHLRLGRQPRAGRRARRHASSAAGRSIVMPVTTPALKIDAVRALGGEVVLHGDSYSDAYAPRARAAKRSSGLTFVHPFDDPDVIAGQGTIAMEILRQHQGPIDAVFVAIGGGGLISGVAAYIKAVRPEIKVIGVQTTDSDAMMRSVTAGRRVELADVGLFSDGTAVKLVGEETFRLAPAAGRRLHRRRHRRRLRRDQGRVRGHAQHPRAGRRARRRRDQAVRARTAAPRARPSSPSPAART